MKKKNITILVLSCFIMLVLLLAACGGEETTTTTTTKSTTTQTPTTPSTTTTTTPPTTTTTTITTTTTTTEITTTTTQTQNPFHGSASGNWTGQTMVGDAVNGTFTVTIDEDGNVTGTFSGTYMGTITGHVDESGNLNAVGTSLLGGQNVEFIWAGTASVSGTTINTQGNWSGPLASGTFSGTGTTS